MLANDRIARLAQLAAARPSASTNTAKSGVYFFDDFEGNELARHWDVINPDEEAYIVEDGKLTVLLSEIKKPSIDTIPNVFRLLKTIPKGDWTITMKVEFQPQTMSEWMRMGAMKRDGKGILASLQMYTTNYGRDTRAYARIDKIARNKSEFTKEMLKFWVKDARDINSRSSAFSNFVKAVYLRLEKKGRRYASYVKFDPGNLDDPKKAVAKDWVRLPKVTSLRVPGDHFTMMFHTTLSDTYLPANSEGLVNVDWVKIEVPQG